MRERPGLFLDRDGVIIRDIDLMVAPADIEILPGAAAAIARAQAAGYACAVVTNQSVVARGMIDEAGLRALHARLDELLVTEGCQPLDGYYYCPHHPEATLDAFRAVCACRKPKPGMVLRAAAELGIDLGRSALVGDRPTDILAAHRAGCARKLLVESPATDGPVLRHVDPADLVEADARFAGLDEAVRFLLAEPA